MPKMIQIRHVPDAAHRKLKARAAMEGLSLSDYLLREVVHWAELPTIAELMERISKRAPVTLRTSTAQIIREERDSR